MSEPLRTAARPILGGVLALAGASHLTVARRAFRAQVLGNLAQLAHHRDASGLDTDGERATRLLGQPVPAAWALWATRVHNRGPR